MIKLLEKSELDKAKSNDRAKEIAEGLKISRKVDALREQLAKEDKTLDDFRKATLATIATEFNLANQEKESVLAEVKLLRAEKADGLKSVDAGMAELRLLGGSLSEREQKLLAQEQALDGQKVAVAITLKNTEDELARAQTQADNAARLHLEANADRVEADKVLTAAKRVKAEADSDRQTTEIILLAKEQDIIIRNNKSLQQEQANLEISKELSEEKIRLADQRATLERAMERLRLTGRP